MLSIVDTAPNQYYLKCSKYHCGISQRFTIQWFQPPDQSWEMTGKCKYIFKFREQISTTTFKPFGFWANNIQWNVISAATAQLKALCLHWLCLLKVNEQRFAWVYTGTCGFNVFLVDSNVDSSRPVGAYVRQVGHQWLKNACYLFVVKPLYETMLTHCQFAPQEQISVIF